MTTFARRLFSFALLACAALPVQAAVDIQHWTTSNGARVYFVGSESLPILDIQIDFAAGSAYDPAGKASLASFTRRLLDAGAGALDEEAIANRLADVGAQMGGGTEEDRASIALRTLSHADEREAAIELLATVLHEPRFPAAVLEREKARSIASLREALTQPDKIAERSFDAAIYGDHPYGVQTTEESIARLTRDDVAAFYRRHYSAPSASIAIVGDVDRARAEAIAEQLAKGLPEAVAVDDLPAVAMPAAKTLRQAHPSAQAHVLLGMPGIKREDPDYYPLIVGNYVLGGGGFVSRLVKEVREKRGFAYSAYSYFAPRREFGPFQIGLQTKGSQIDDALAVVRNTLAEFIADGPTEAELAAARDNTINGFGLRLDSNRKMLGYIAVIGFYELPLDWLEQYPREVAKLTPAQVKDAFQRRVRLEHLVSVVVGGDGDAKGGAAVQNSAR